MRATAMAGLLALVTTPFASVSAQAQTPLPSASLRLGCHDEGSATTGVEIDGIVNLLEFAREHDGRPVYLDAVIEANDGAGTCSRDLSAFPDQPEPEPFRAMVTLDPCRSGAGDEATSPCARPGMVHLRAFGPPLAFSHAIILPAEGDLPPSLPYRIGGYGDWLNYQGPFIVRHFSGTGYEYATFDIPDPALSGIWDKAGIKARSAPRP